jgi:hypothetical protein
MSSTASRTASRLLIFGLLSPPVGLIVALGVIASTAPGANVTGFGLLAPLLTAYFLGLLPALATALVDSILTARRTTRRLLWTTLAGIAWSLPAIATVIGLSGIAGRLLLAWVVVGAVPAAICSWLARQLDR